MTTPTTNPRIYHEAKQIGKGKAVIHLYKLDLPIYPPPYVVVLQWWADRLDDGPNNEHTNLHQFTTEASAIRFTIELFDDYSSKMELSQ